MLNFVFRVVLGIILSVLLVESRPIDLQLGARPYGMGGAFVAIADDINAVYWNPAGLVQLKDLAVSEHNWVNQDFMGVNINYLNVAVPLSGVGVIGGSWLMIYTGLESGDPDDLNDYVKDHFLDNTFSVCFSRQLWDKALIFEHSAVGLTFNRYLLNTKDYQEAGIGFDLSFFTLFPQGVRLGLMVRSLGADLKGERLTPEYRIGTGYVWPINESNCFSLGMDLLFKQEVEYSDNTTLEPVGLNIKGFGGLEYKFLFDQWQLALRLGANDILLSQRSGLGITCGLGIGFKDYMLDYAFKYDTHPEEALGIAHRISFSYQPQVKQPTKAKVLSPPSPTTFQSSSPTVNTPVKQTKPTATTSSSSNTKTNSQQQPKKIKEEKQ